MMRRMGFIRCIRVLLRRLKQKKKKQDNTSKTLTFSQAMLMLLNLVIQIPTQNLYLISTSTGNQIFQPARDLSGLISISLKRKI